MTLAIYCSGNLGNEILDMIQNDDIDAKFDEIIFVDDFRTEKEFRGIRVVNYELLKAIYGCSDVQFVIATGEPKFRRIIREKLLSDGYSFSSSLASRRSYIGRDCGIGKGNIIFPFVYISNRTVIGDNNIFHSGAHIIGETEFGSDCFISLGAFVGVNSVIMDEVFIGPNACLTDHVRMGERSILGIGSTLLKNAEDDGVYLGCPATLKRRNSGRIYK